MHPSEWIELEAGPKERMHADTESIIAAIGEKARERERRRASICCVVCLFICLFSKKKKRMRESGWTELTHQAISAGETP